MPEEGKRQFQGQCPPLSVGGGPCKGENKKICTTSTSLRQYFMAYHAICTQQVDKQTQSNIQHHTVRWHQEISLDTTLRLTDARLILMTSSSCRFDCAHGFVCTNLEDQGVLVLAAKL